MSARNALILTFALAVGLMLGAAQPTQDVDRERDLQVKAAMLVKIPTFVTFAEDAFEAPDSPIVLGVIGRDPFGRLLERTCEGQTAQGRAFEVRRFDSTDRYEALRERLTACHVLWIAESEQPRLALLLRSLENAHLLTIAEFEGAAEASVMIELHHKPGGKVGFRINRSAAERNGLRLAAQLLKLSEIVATRGGRDGLP